MTSELKFFQLDQQLESSGMLWWLVGAWLKNATWRRSGRGHRSQSDGSFDNSELGTPIWYFEQQDRSCYDDSEGQRHSSLSKPCNSSRHPTVRQYCGDPYPPTFAGKSSAVDGKAMVLSCWFLVVICCLLNPAISNCMPLFMLIDIFLFLAMIDHDKPFLDYQSW